MEINVELKDLINTMAIEIKEKCWCKIDDNRFELAELRDLIDSRLKESIETHCIE